MRTDVIDDCAGEFSGSNTKVEMTKSVSYTDPTSFTVKGAHIKDGQLVMGGSAIGVVLKTAGSTYGDWRRINGNGDDLTQDDLTSD